MERGKRIPLHDHSDRYSGGPVSNHSIVKAIGGVTGTIGGSNGAGGSSGDTSGFVLNRWGGHEVYYDLGSLGAAGTVSLANGNYQYGVLAAGTVTFAFTGANSLYADSFALELTQDGTGGRVVAFPAEVSEGSALATMIGTAADAISLFVFVTHDGGSTYLGYLAGGGSVTSSATLGTAAPTTIAFGDVASAGTATAASREDHRHGAPDEPASGGGHILLADGRATPFTFDDMLQMDDGSDFMWSDP